MQRVVAVLVEVTVVNMNASNLEENLRQLNERLGYFSSLYEEKKSEFTFTPVKYFNDAKAILEDIKPISTSTAGARLKQLCGVAK